MTYTSPLDGMTFDEPGRDTGDVLLDHYRSEHGGRPRAELLGRRAECIARAAELKGYGRLSQAQAREADDLIAEQIILDDLVTRSDVEIRRSKIEQGRQVMADPANREGPEGAVGAPALVKGLGDRLETAAEVIQRMGNPWRQEGGPLNRETGARRISRAHTMIEGLEAGGAFVHDGAEKLAQALAESSGWPGMTVKRSRDQQQEAAELVLALSNPHYAEAFRSVLRYPGEFCGAGGTGFETFTDEQRQAWRDVRTNMVCRAAFAETSGAAGAFALPLQLDPNIVITNAGVAGPFRKLARTVVGTSNVWEGIASAGSTANWVAEGATVTDTTPTLAQIAITPYKSAVWIYGSFESMTDTDLSGQVPMLVDEARFRLETTAFTTGTGTAQPFGVITRGASDATVGVLTAAIVYGMHQNLPPRFRVYDGARPAWISNVTIQDARQRF
jgi:Phage capsid family